ncbi:23S rRNA pseudouridine(1911/1915/1917) synthase RluD [Alteromonas lipotrueiana]|uniref:23S rRNA pseudouridine(1911/1915/1917) synthase RluD n=1 Tax=Alteromonas lipotrueiana TaxID=2803815 RepID=UPI001C469F0A|nr:23S rRNA pseudouridine(1911/1915/1917) synthase RluD [Alteromonas lipotrueiana]
MTQSSNTVKLEAVTESQHFGQRLDQVLADLFPEYSRSKLKSWIVDGSVTVNGEVNTTPRHKMQLDEHVCVNAEMEVQTRSQPQDIKLDIVYEDEHILLINKPADMVVHPGAGNSDGTLLNALLAHVPDIDKVPRAGIVHRLDKDTTGLMVVAKTLPAQTHLVAQLQERTMSREYEALAIGTMVGGGMVDERIGRHATKRTLMAVRENGKPATTHFRVKEKFRAHTYIRLKLESGRTHQIRVHMTHIKHPLAGDPVYGGRPRLPKGASDEFVHILRNFRRQALHAVQLSLFHPDTEEWMSWQAPLPQDMQQLIDIVRKDTQEHGFDEL